MWHNQSNCFLFNITLNYYNNNIHTSASSLDLSVTPPLACRYLSLVSDNCSCAERNSTSKCSSWLLIYFSRLPIFSNVREISSWSLSRYDLVSISEDSIPSLCWCICSTCTRQSCNVYKAPVKIYRSRGPEQNAWGQGLFECLESMVSIKKFSSMIQWGHKIFLMHWSHASINFDRSLNAISVALCVQDLPMTS